MKRIKKVISMLAAAGMVLSMTACGGSDANETANGAEKQDSGELVIYSAAAQNVLDAYIPGFEKETGINVEIVSAGTGELLKRIESESENPLGDVEFGGTISVVLPYVDYFEPYVSANEDAQMDSCKEVEGCITSYSILPMCLAVNTDLIGDIEINSYEDLLNPELKGKIAYMDPSQSSTGLQQLTAMIQAKGEGDEEKGWEFVRKLIDNLDGRMLSSTGAVIEGVAHGEYVVGLTHEGNVMEMINQGYPVKAIYQSDGMFVSTSTVQIIKGCKNMENAKKFVDYVTSYDAQVSAGKTISERGTRNDIPAPEGMENISEMNIMVEDVYNTLENNQKYLDRFKDMYTE